VRRFPLFKVVAWALGACVATSHATGEMPSAVAPIPPGHSASAAPPHRAKTPPVQVKLIDINSASRKELMSLAGVGDADAERIIRGRPYLTKAELVTKHVMPTGPYLSIRNRLVAMPPKKQKGKA
jgi:DNA uptake protein ComE-like DNA-binding protein